MKALFTFILVVATAFASLAQNANPNYGYLDSLPQSNIQLFAHTPGLILKRESVELASVGNIRLEQIKLTDVINNQAQTGLYIYISSTTPGIYVRSKAYLDIDEIPGLLNAINYWLKLVTTEPVPDTYIEYSYMSRGGVKMELDNSRSQSLLMIKRKWNMSLGNFRAQSYLSVKDLTKLKTVLETARATL